MVNLSDLYNLLIEIGVEFVTGVPDTLLNDFCLGLDSHWNSDRHVIASNEGNAIALAAGYHLTTNTVPLVYMQNSGIGNAVNPLVSLVDSAVYSIPMILVIGWRGDPELSDWPQHMRQGELTPKILETLGIGHRIVEGNQDSVEKSFEWAAINAAKENRPFALIIKKGVLAREEKAGFVEQAQHSTISREEAIKTILLNVPNNTIFVASTGRITREIHALRENLGLSHDYDFLNVGAMGHALSIASGIALGNSNKQVICLDGDGAALMHMGSLPISANLPLNNLTHIVLNNGAHESVGGQNTVAFSADMNGIAQASGFYVRNAYINNLSDLSSSLSEVLAVNKPAFLEVRIRKGMRNDMPILKFDLKESKQRFMKKFKD